MAKTILKAIKYIKLQNKITTAITLSKWHDPLVSMSSDQLTIFPVFQTLSKPVSSLWEFVLFALYLKF